MPLYEISHMVDLSDEQQDAIASSITTIHAERFVTPSLFVNIRFAKSSRYVGYVSGKRQAANFIEAHVRTGPSRTIEMYNELCEKIALKWKEVVPTSPDVRIFVFGDIVAGMEHGTALPAAGKDKEWLKDNWAKFESMAQAGDTQMEDLLEEIDRRQLIQNC